MNTPKIRFKGFEDDWEQRKLGDICEQLSQTIDPKRTPNARFEEYSMPAFDQNMKATVVEGSTMNSTRKIISKECLLINKLNVRKKRIWLVEKPSDNAVCSAEFIPICSDEINLRYLKYFTLNDSFTKYLEDCSSGSSNSQKRVTPDIIMNAEIIAPVYAEQKKIGDYFRNLDHLITLHQRKCDETKQLKKFMLQKMFPKNGEKNPEIRFEGFTDDWEQRKLDDWGTFYYGKSCPKWSVTQEATIPCIRYGELYTKFGAKIDRVYSYTDMPADNLRFSKGTEVLIPRVGEDPMDYNHCTWLSLPNIAIGEMISVFNTEQDPYFSAIMFNATLQKEFAIRVEGGSVTNLYFEKLKNIDVLYPSLDEQERIATYFGKLDHLITLHQRKCEKLKELKKFMLQNMFV